MYNNSLLFSADHRPSNFTSNRGGQGAVDNDGSRAFMNFGNFLRFSKPSSTTPKRSTRSRKIMPTISVSRSIRSTSSTSDSDHGYSTRDRRYDLATSEELSRFENLPTEILQSIGSAAHTDGDLRNLSETAPHLAGALTLDESSIWRTRFLATYDYPFVNDSHEFAVAYKLRQFVLRNFVNFDRSEDARARVQLEVIRDLILESYNRPYKYLPFPKHSPNLALLSDTSWATVFLASPFSGYGDAKYSKPDVFFNSLQLVLSHLVLSPLSAHVQRILTSRERYDICQVYNYNRPLALLYRTVSYPQEDIPSISEAEHGGQTNDAHLELDTHALLHIRNFWHRHLTETSESSGECTYNKAASILSKLNKSPRAWCRPLQEMNPVSSSWIGHYSCLHPWPKSITNLEETQSSAQEWECADPMVLDWVTSEDNIKDCFWPPAFDSIPALRDTSAFDTAAPKTTRTVYIRGSTNFFDIALASVEDPRTMREPINQRLSKYHPFTAPRVRGYIHDIPAPVQRSEQTRKRANRKRSRSTMKSEGQFSDDTSIPGWKRIVVIMYKPTTRYLLQVLQYAQEDYGGAFEGEIAASLNTANIWNNPDQEGIDSSTTNSQSSGASTLLQTNLPASNNMTIGQHTPPTDEELEEQLQLVLSRRITSFTKKYEALVAANTSGQSLPSLFSPGHIISLEDAFSGPSYLSWNDNSIEFAYVYEGVLIPGSKIMLGRFYRCHGIDGLGDGMEVGTDGVGVEVRPVTRETNSANADDTKSEKREQIYETFTNVSGTGEVIATGSSYLGLDRGPFVFWSC